MTNPSTVSKTNVSTSAKNNQSIADLFRSITLQEWLTAAVIGAALGVAYFGFTMLYEVVKPFLKPLGLKYLTSGLWILAPVLLGNMVRKPGVALFASVLAAVVQGTYSEWGMTASLLYGTLQGAAVELVFLAFLYRKWSFAVLSFAASLSATCSYAYDYYLSDRNLSFAFNLIQWAGFVVSAIVLAAWLTQYLSARLLKTGLMDTFLIARKP